MRARPPGKSRGPAPRSRIALLLALVTLGGALLGLVWLRAGTGGVDSEGSIGPVARAPGAAPPTPREGALPLAPRDPRMLEDDRSALQDVRGGASGAPIVVTEDAIELDGEALRARVVDRADGSPIAGAVVTQYRAARDVEFRTDAQGWVDLVLDRAPIRVRQADYVDAWAPEPPAARPLTIELQRRARFRGRVASASGLPVADVSVRLGGAGLSLGANLASLDADVEGVGPRGTGHSGGESGGEGAPGTPGERSTRSDGEGRFEFSGLVPGSYALLLVDSGGEYAALAEPRVVVEADDREEHLFVLEHGARLLGTVRLQRSSTPLADVSVELRPDWDLWEGAAAPGASATTDREGRFELTGLARGTWTVCLRSPWGAVVEEELALPGAGETLEHTFEVRPAAQVSGRVYDESGAVLPGARVWVTARPEERDYEWGVERGAAIDSPFLAGAVCDADGEYRLAAVPAREALWIVALPPGPAHPDERPGHFEPLRLVEGEVRAGLDLVLAHGTQLAGRVTDEDGRPLPGVHVEAWHARWGRTSPGRAGETDVEGRFDVGPLPYGHARVEFSCPGYRDAVQGVGLEPGVDVLIEQELVAAQPVLGWVVDETGWGIEGASLGARLHPKSRKVRATTDSFGAFRLEGLTEGRWNVRAKADGFTERDPEGLDVDVPGGAPLAFVLASKERLDLASVYGEVVWKADGSPVWDLEFNGVRGGATRLRGTAFEVHGMRPGRAKIVASAPGMEPLLFDPVDLGPGDALDLGRYEVRHATHLTVRVHDAAGAPVRGAKVQLEALPAQKHGWGESRPGRGLRETSRKGTYENEEVPRYAWRLRVTHGRFAPHSQELVVTGGRQSVSVVLRSPVR